MEERPSLTEQQREEIRKGLRCRSDEYDIEVLSGPHPDVSTPLRWAVRMSLGKRTVILREPARGNIILDTGSRGPGARPTTGKSDINDAIVFAEEWLAAEREQELFKAGVQVVVESVLTDLTVGDVCRVSVQTDLPSKKTWSDYVLAMRVARATLRSETKVRMLHDDQILEAIQQRIAGLPSIGLGSVCPVTAISNFKNFSTILTKVGKLRRSDGSRLFANPIRDMKWPTTVTVSQNGRTRTVRVAKKKRGPFEIEQMDMLLHPFTYRDTAGRMHILPAPADVVDSSGVLRAILTIAQFTGRRFNAIRQLRMENLVYGVEEMRRVLEEADEEARPEWAEVFSFGLIDFLGEHDKQGYHWPVPMGSVLRKSLDVYLRSRGSHPGPLFPSIRDPSKPLSREVILRARRTDPRTGKVKSPGRFECAWELARDYLARAGSDPDALMPLRSGYKLHRIRAFFATHMERLGYGRANSGNEDGHNFDDAVNYMAGWRMGGSVKQDRYIPPDPQVLMAVAEWKCASEVTITREREQGERAERSKSKLLKALYQLA